MAYVILGEGNLVSSRLRKTPFPQEKKVSPASFSQTPTQLLKHSQVVINRSWQLPQWDHSEK